MASRQKAHPAGMAPPCHFSTPAGGASKNPIAMGAADRSNTCCRLCIPLSIARLLEAQAQSELQTPGIVYRRNLPEGCRWISRVRFGAECPVQSQIVAMIQQIERFGHRLEAQALSERECAAHPRADAEQVVAR